MVVYPRKQSLGIGVNIMTPEYDVAMVDWRSGGAGGGPPPAPLVG